MYIMEKLNILLTLMWIRFFCGYLCLDTARESITSPETTYEELCQFEGMCLNCSQSGCDDMCQYYDNECCANSSTHLHEKWQYSCVRKFPEMYDLHLDCHGSFKGVYGVLMVSKCSKFWTDATIKAKCENSSDDSPLSRVPVYDNFNNKIIYQNMYCAFCNWLSLHKLKFWRFDLLCNNGISTDLRGYLMDFDSDLCFIRLHYREDHKICAMNVIEYCDENVNTSSSVRTRCENGIPQNVYVWRDEFDTSTFNTYKNEFCAQCNGETGKLQCWAFQAFTCWPRDLPPYTRVQTIVSLHIQGHSSSGSIQLLNASCGDGVIYDPFVKKCLNVTCLPSLYTCISGQCILAKLSESEFEIVNDTWLFFFALGELFQKGRYFMDKEDVLLCLDDKQNDQFQIIRKTIGAVETQDGSSDTTREVINGVALSKRQTISNFIVFVHFVYFVYKY